MPTAAQTPPIGAAEGAELRPTDRLTAGRAFRVYLAGYDSRALWRAWNELQVVMELVELGAVGSGAATLGSALLGGVFLGPLGFFAGGVVANQQGDPVGAIYNRPPALLGRNSVGDVYDCTAVVTSRARAGTELTWGQLWTRLSDAFVKNGTEGSLGGWASEMQLSDGADALRRVGAVQSDVAAGAAGVLEGAGSAVGGAGDVARGAGNLAASGAEGFAQLGAASREAPLLTFGLLAVLVLGGLYLYRDLK